jgi:hypothetical protein
LSEKVPQAGQATGTAGILAKTFHHAVDVLDLFDLDTRQVRQQHIQNEERDHHDTRAIVARAAGLPTRFEHEMCARSQNSSLKTGGAGRGEGHRFHGGPLPGPQHLAGEGDGDVAAGVPAVRRSQRANGGHPAGDALAGGAPLGSRPARTPRSKRVTHESGEQAYLL